MDQIQIPWLLLVAILGLLGLQTLRAGWLARRPAALARRRAKRALEGERGAESILRRCGYRVIGRQVPGGWRITVNGEPVDVELRADFLVTRRGRRLVAEAKTGRAAPRATHGPTRRQLLEYRQAFEVDGVLLVDAERGEVSEVEFPAMPRRKGTPALWLVGGAALGAAVAWALAST